jgi:hypothetical protein
VVLNISRYAYLCGRLKMPQLAQQCPIGLTISSLQEQWKPSNTQPLGSASKGSAGDDPIYLNAKRKAISLADADYQNPPVSSTPGLNNAGILPSRQVPAADPSNVPNNHASLEAGTTEMDWSQVQEGVRHVLGEVAAPQINTAPAQIESVLQHSTPTRNGSTSGKPVRSGPRQVS